MTSRTRALIVVGIAWFALCVTGEWVSVDSTQLPKQPQGPVVRLMSASLPQPLTAVAHHYWFAVARGAEPFQRWEVWQHENRGGTSWGHVHRGLNRWDGRVGGGPARLHVEWHGDEALRFIDCLERVAPTYEHRERYLAWPGPNSNTFVSTLLRQCGVQRSLGGTAVGKDYLGWMGASLSPEGTGVQLETPLVGVLVGAREGVQLHVLSLTLGIDVWPPAIVSFVGDGRLGFADW